MEKTESWKILTQALKDFYQEQMEHVQENIPPATMKQLTSQPLTFADMYIYYKGKLDMLDDFELVIKNESEVN